MGIVKDLLYARMGGAFPVPSSAALIKRLYMAAVMGSAPAPQRNEGTTQKGVNNVKNKSHQ